MSKVEELKQNVKRHWMMAVTGSPQFVTATNPLSTASGVISLIVSLLNLNVVCYVWSKKIHHSSSYGSDYKSSIFLIVITQNVGIYICCAALLCRCVSSVITYSNFLITTPNVIPLVDFRVEKYWTQKLCEWKQSPIQFCQLGSRSRPLIYTLKSVIISLCIYLQMLIVIFCKAILLIPKITIASYFYCLDCLMLLVVRLFTWPPVVSTTHDMEMHLRNYCLHIHDGMEVNSRVQKQISESMNSIITKAEKEQNMDLFELLERATYRFQGVENFVNDNDQPALPFGQLANSWSSPIISLTCIAISLPNIDKDTIRRLIRSVSEGLSYTHLTEKCINRGNEYVCIRRATTILWNEVELKCKWLGKAIGKDAFGGKTAREILEWFSDRAEEILMQILSMTENMVDNTTTKELISTNSMYRIAVTILPRRGNNTLQIDEERLFAHLSGMIADIFSACFTNLPRVITVKCNESVIEKRQESVKAAAKLLGKTTKIIRRLEKRELPSMEPEKMAYVDEWRRYMKESIP